MTGNRKNKFLDISTNIVNNFLQTVVILDDKAVMEDIPVVTQLNSPGILDDIANSPSVNNDTIENNNTDVNSQSESQNNFDVQEAIDKFAAKGIICSVLRPLSTENPWRKIEKIANRADVIILDWRLNDQGEATNIIIKRLIEKDITEGPYHRLIIIYTAETNIPEISDIIYNTIYRKITAKQIDNDAVIMADNLRISIYIKGNTNIKKKYATRVISLEELVDKVSEEFAKINPGLISNVAMESLSVLRRNTPLLLGKFKPELDPAYLSHRTLILHPEDAEDLLVDLITSELHSILQSCRVKNNANIDVIDAWINYNGRRNTICKKNSQNERLDYPTLLQCLKDSINNPKITVSLNGFKRNKTNTITNIFCENGNNYTVLDNEFAILTSLKSKYDPKHNEPKLTLGTIIKSESKFNDTASEYWLCLQPKCDCIRIDKKRKFFFIPLNITNQNGSFALVIYNERLPVYSYTDISGNSDFIILDYEKFIRLNLNYRLYESNFLEFAVNKPNDYEIISKLIGEDYIFTTTNGIFYKWVAELKFEQSQRIANEFATNISRVGIDESEYLRLAGPRKNIWSLIQN